MISRENVLALVAGAAIVAIAAAGVLYGNRAATVHEGAETVDEAGAGSAAGTSEILPGTLPASLPGVVMVEGAPTVPDAVFYDDSGAENRLVDFQGQFVVLNLWATWCAPCVAELPMLARAQEMLGDDALILPVDMEDNKSAEELAAFLERNGAGSLPVYIDGDLSLMRGFEAYSVGLPYTIFIDASGNQIATASGPQEWDDPAAVEYIRAMARGS